MDPSLLQHINLDNYNYLLPDGKIARYPLPGRDESKLLVYNHGRINHKVFNELPGLLPAESFLFFNNTRVIPARLFFRKATGALMEVFLLHPVQPSNITSITMAAKGFVVFECMVGNLKKWKHDEVLERTLEIAGKSIVLKASLQRGDKLQITLRWSGDYTFSELLEAVGQIPIPPYLGRDTEEKDKETYQTVYAKNDGSVAAPTAGLHFTEKVFEELKAHHIGWDFITLHVGAGTFQPVKVKDLSQHPMHREQIVFSRENIENIITNLDRIIPVGTTSCRALESLYWYGVKLLLNKDGEFFIDKLFPYKTDDKVNQLQAMQAVLEFMTRNTLDHIIGETELLIVPGYEFKLTKGLITNFHQPSSTLLLLVDALVQGRWKIIYNEALENNYRFLSYGDSSLLLP